MPIRFRCAYCNQLLGIAKRKAGTVVRCPTCAGQVVVPNVGMEATERDDGPEPPLFERSDFDQVFKVNVSSSPQPIQTSSAPPAGAWGTHAEPPYDVERLDPAQVAVATPQAPPPLSKGIVLSSTLAAIFAASIILALALAFGAGFLVGRFLQ